MINDRKNYLDTVKRIVVKVGTSTLTHSSSGLLNLNRIDNLVRQLADLHNQGFEVILVTSGAVGAGMGKLGLKSKPKTIPEKQAAAAIGQGILMQMYEKFFSEYGQTIAQILITKEDITNRSRFLNARNTFFTLLEYGAIPIINENDAVVTDEIKIKVGDNDTLSALVSSLVEADLLIILSDIDGLFDNNPKDNPNAHVIHYVNEITEEIVKVAGGAGTNLGTGGMATKIKAARIAISSGTAMVIANGENPKIITDILSGNEIGTWFKPEEHPLGARKHWLAYGTGTDGKLFVDKGAANALMNDQKSLLPSGILSIEGIFNEGHIVAIIDPSGKEIARGVTNYNSYDIDIIKGLKCSEIEDKLGHKFFDEVVHRNNLVIF